MTPTSRLLCSLSAAVGLLFLSACGGGSGTDSTTTSTATSATSSTGSTSTTGAATSPVTTTSSAVSSATSSGAISAFGSVFVNGHEFDTRSASVIDNDTGATSTSAAALEVGMTVDVKAASTSTTTSPVADSLYVHPLVRGIVDASDTTGGTLTVLGQSVQLTASTNFSDHRACVTATSSPCTAVTGQTGLTATSGTGSTAVAGSYVTVYGYLYAATATATNANIVATLVSVNDTPTTTTAAAYKAEGTVTAVGTSRITIGSLAIDLSAATCYVDSGSTACASAYSVGQIVSAYGTTAPTLPATALTATAARLRSTLTVQTAGASVELEGKVSGVTTSPASFVVRGVTVDASSLSTLPANGDIVRVAGTVATGGTTITASSVTVLQAAASATVAFEGDVASVAAGTSASTYVLSVLGQSITVNSNTRLADRSVSGNKAGTSTTNPFNITTFQTYLAASASQHLIVRTQADASTGALTALSVTIVAASTVSSVSGTVDATPAAVNSSVSGTPTTFSVHGLGVSASPSSVVKLSSGGRNSTTATTTSTTTVSAGDLVLVRGTFASGTLSVAAPTGTLSAASTQIVIDSGVPSSDDHGGF